MAALHDRPYGSTQTVATHDDAKDARISQLEAQVREREAECERRMVAKNLDYGELLRRAESAEAALAAAREENERLTGRTVEAFVLARLETEMIGPSLSPDLCEQAINIIAELRRVRRDLGGGNPLAALRSRADDAGRVERVRKELLELLFQFQSEMQKPEHDEEWARNFADIKASAVLAAADREGE